MRVVVIGGGIAGLSAAWHLADRCEVVLLERERVLASHSSGRNAAIFRHLEGSEASVALAVRSRELLDQQGLPWLDRVGAVYVARTPASLSALEALGRASEVPHQRLGPVELARKVPVLAAGEVDQGLWVPGDGIIDTHGVITFLAREATRRGAHVRTGTSAAELLVAGGRVGGVRLEDGAVIEADVVVNAAGAWAAGLGAPAGVPLSLTPRRRHLTLLDVPGVGAELPVVWRVDEQVYFRPESGGILASPCDERDWPPGIPPVDGDALVRLGERLARTAPGLAESGVRRSWACLRTFAPDRELVAGLDPRLPGLAWLAGLGGRGMTVGVGAGEVLAHAVLGAPHPLAGALAPDRLLSGQGR